MKLETAAKGATHPSETYNDLGWETVLIVK
jgi:hypothetical protein